MNRIFVCSDLHFFHDKDFIWAKRGFESVEEMNREIVARFNETIDENDEVYILGDIGLAADVEDILSAVSQLNGKKYLALGNHDSDKRAAAYKESGIFEDVQFAYRLTYRHRTFYLSHYPTIVGNITGPKVYNIHGHTHSAEHFEFKEQGWRNYNVSLESNNCYPLLLDDIIEDLKKEGM